MARKRTAVGAARSQYLVRTFASQVSVLVPGKDAQEEVFPVAYSATAVAAVVFVAL